MSTPLKPSIVVETETRRPISPSGQYTPAEPPVDNVPKLGMPELEMLARWMDSVFQIPGSRVRFGFDAILGLIPGLGDTVTSMVSLFILHEASKRGISKLTQARMAMNIIVDYLVGSIPVLGDVFDVYWKANQMNLAILRQHTMENPTSQRRMQTSDWFFFACVGLVIMALLAGSLAMSYFMIKWLGKALSL
jgi:hypothetical protein